MYKYERIIYWSENDGKFIVEVPELSGCIADGETAEQAVKNAEIVISEMGGNCAGNWEKNPTTQRPPDVCVI